MHELGIAQDFWRIIKQQAEENKLKVVTKIVFAVGEASGIEIEFLRHSLEDHTLVGTIAQKAQLDFVAIGLKAKCNICHKEINKDEVKDLCCPHCGSANIEIISGKEIYVQSIEGE